jgi:uncharacterized membrane protein YraQ (UPF0718 family)
MPLVPLISAFFIELWSLTVEMAPYLLLGFGVAGLLRALVSEEWVKRHLGKDGFRQIVKAVVIGIPLPLCSCGVIPVAAGIHRQGGRPGAVAAFTAATPQTGVDAIAASVGMLGWPFTIVRLVIAFINGIISGLIVDGLAGSTSSGKAALETGQNGPHDSPTKGPATVPSCCSSAPTHHGQTGADCCGTPPNTAPTESCCATTSSAAAAGSSNGVDIRSGLKFGLLTLPRDLFPALLMGLVLAAIISSVVPQEFFDAIPGGRFGTYLAMTLVSLPLYVCSTGSIPLAFSFLAAGLSPGAVLLFLIAGPATNTATVTALWSILGGRATIGYIVSIILTAWGAAYALDLSGLSLLVSGQLPHHHDEPGLFRHAMAVLLVGLLVTSRVLPTSKRP